MTHLVRDDAGDIVISGRAVAVCRHGASRPILAVQDDVGVEDVTGALVEREDRDRERLAGGLIAIRPRRRSRSSRPGSGSSDRVSVREP